MALKERVSVNYIECPHDPNHVVVGTNEVALYLGLTDHLREEHNVR